MEPLKCEAVLENLLYIYITVFFTLNIYTYYKMNTYVLY
jgi:hypothetical protein